MKHATSFSSTEPSPPLGHNLFFGLLPPVGTADDAHHLAEDLIRSGQASGAVRPARVLHITLLSVGTGMADPPRAEWNEALCAWAKSVRHGPFVVSLDRVETWGRSPSGRPVVAVADDGAIGVEGLARSLREAVGLRVEANLKPHMTLLYGAGPAASLPIEPISWSVRDFVLIHSFAGLTRYELVGRFPLAA